MTPTKKTLLSLTLIALIAVPMAFCTSCSDEGEGAPTKSHEVIAELPHNENNFTQGLVVADGHFYEGTGQKGESRLIRIDMKTGEELKSVKLANQLFGEGVVVLNDLIYQLTWHAQKAIVFDLKKMIRKRQFKYEGQGWGITTDGKQLIMSNGTATISFRNEKFEEQRTIVVKDREDEISQLNELEYINGEIWANVWQQERIACIDPKTGAVKYWVDFTGLRDKLTNKDVDAGVLNGIAYDAETKKIWVTGKNWSKMFQIEVK